MKLELKINDKSFNLKWVINFLYTLLGVVIMVSIVLLSATAIAEGGWIKERETLKIILSVWVSIFVWLFAVKWWNV
jgi:uncharacterized membrane protein